MDWADSDAQAAFREEVRSFIDARLPAFYKARAQEIDPSGEHDWQADIAIGEDDAREAALEWAEALAEHGWAAPHWPTEYGGAGLTSMEQFIFNSEMAFTGAPPVGGGGLRLLGPTILVHGTEEQKQKFLGPTLRGEMLWAQGYSEPGAGSDLASLQTRADPRRRRVRDQRPEDVDLLGPQVQLAVRHVPHRPGRPEAPRHHLHRSWRCTTPEHHRAPDHRDGLAARHQ